MIMFKQIKETEKNRIVALLCVVAVVIVSLFSAGVIVSNSFINAKTAVGLSKGEAQTAVAVKNKAIAIATEPTTQVQIQINPDVISLEKETIALKVGGEYSIQFARSVKKENLQLSFSSDVNTVAQVDEQGVITGISQGTALITCTDLNSKATAKLKVVVSEPVYPDNIELDKTHYSMTAIGELLKLTATLTPERSITETTVNWLSSDETVATVNNGLVTAVDDGTATITAYTDNDISATCEIYVQPDVKCDELYLDYIAYEFTGPQNESVTLTPTIYPLDATNQTVKWYTTNGDVAVVDQKGNVTVVGDGMCSIICSTTDGTYLSVECAITATDTMSVVTHQAETSVYVPVNPVVADTVLDEALRYVGIIPYVWGGTDLSTGVDCSGFICAIYERFGINLWGIRTDLYLAGTEVASITEAKAGDILCYEGHVAIYDGNGGRIHAYDEGYMIMHDTNIDGYYTIRRILE